MKSIQKASIVLVLGLGIGPIAHANMVHFKNFKAAYPNFKPATCVVCHGEGKSLNPYGLDLQANKFDYKAIEALDSDGDTFKNLDELNASTNPGNKDSHPTLETEDNSLE